MNAIFTTRNISSFVAAVILIITLVGWWWSMSPPVQDIKLRAQAVAAEKQQTVVPGYTTATALIDVVDTLLSKTGGYITNDVTPPGIFMDNMPNWEFGALEMSRDLALSMRKDFSRSQSQSIENPFLTKAQPSLNFDSNRWLLPSSEGEYSDALVALNAYRDELSNSTAGSSQFYARADNLRDYLKQVEKRLGSMSQKLSASVGTDTLNTDLAGDPSAKSSTPEPDVLQNKTSWFELDDNFYEARGACWAVLHFLKAIEVDFEDVLQKKNAKVSLQQIIRELEATQQTVYSPVILNGSGFGMLANHSLVMANYISRANAALIELSELLNQG